MTTVRIWALESDYDAKAVECLANKLKSHLRLGNLRIRLSGASTLSSIQPRLRKSIPKRVRTETSSGSPLSQATHNYLKEEVCVIFIIDRDSLASVNQRRKESNSRINQIKDVMKDKSLGGKVFLVEAVHEIEAWLLIDCLGIFCHFASQRAQYRENCRGRVTANKTFRRLIGNKQKGDTEKIVEPESGGKGAKEYLGTFSEEILLKLNPRMPQKNVERERYREAISAEVAEHVDINQHTLQRNNSLRKLGERLAQFK